MKVTFSELAWQQFLGVTNPAHLRRIKALIADIQRNDHNGIGKPEQLRGNLSGRWSRRIDQEHRLVYRLEDDAVIIESCQNHYSR